MEKNQIKRAHKNKKKRQIGRGGVKAKTAGRGTKGQNARSGRKKRPELRDFIKRFPKLRGRGVNSNKSILEKPFILDLNILNKNFENGQVVSPESLVEKKLVNTFSGKVGKIKILSDGELTKKLKFSKLVLSKKTLEKINKAGGEIA